MSHWKGRVKNWGWFCSLLPHVPEMCCLLKHTPSSIKALKGPFSKITFTSCYDLQLGFLRLSPSVVQNTGCSGYMRYVLNGRVAKCIRGGWEREEGREWGPLPEWTHMLWATIISQWRKLCLEAWSEQHEARGLRSARHFWCCHSYFATECPSKRESLPLPMNKASLPTPVLAVNMKSALLWPPKGSPRGLNLIFMHICLLLLLYANTTWSPIQAPTALFG